MWKTFCGQITEDELKRWKAYWSGLWYKWELAGMIQGGDQNPVYCLMIKMGIRPIGVACPTGGADKMGMKATVASSWFWFSRP
jgi:hypothetical protein